jgi:hypothetical protein
MQINSIAREKGIEEKRRKTSATFGVLFSVLNKIDIYVKFASFLLCHTYHDTVRREKRKVKNR